MNRTRPLAALSLLFALVIAPAPHAIAAEPLDATALLHAVLEQIAAEPAAAEVTTTTHIAAEGMKQEFSSTHALYIQKPNLFAWRQIAGQPSIDIYSDGEHLYTHISAMRRYTEEPAPNSLSDLAESSAIDLAEGFGAPFLSLFLASDIREALAEAPIEDLGEETIDERPHRKVRFTGFGTTYHAWIEAGSPPRLRRLQPDMSEIIQEARSEMGADNLELHVNIDFAAWRTDPEPIDAGAFRFSPPATSEKVDELFEGMGAPDAMPSDALIDEAAPAFTLERLTGGEQSLAAHEGEIVILDFWATWCPPCVKALPLLVSVANDYKDRGVVFHAVNVRENNQRVETFLERQGLEMSVLMDRDGAVADLYKVTGIPQTVVIDKEGIVRIVHVGLIPNLERQLRDELDELLAAPVPES